MTGNQHRRAVSDRARRRAIRALAARLGVPYSVATRLLRTQMSDPAGRRDGGRAAGADHHGEWLFAMRERRTFAMRVHDTRMAADLPLGRAAHLVGRFPSRRVPAVPHNGADAGPRYSGPRYSGPRYSGPLYSGENRRTVLGMLYAVLAHESPTLLPTVDELGWVAELGEEDAVDIACASLDRAARLLLDGDRWRLWTRVEAALLAGETSPDRRVRDAAIVLGRDFRAVALHRSVEGARQTLDALLVAAHDGHPPGTRVRIGTGPVRDRAATVVGIRWQRVGPPIGYEVCIDGSLTTVTLDGEDVVVPERDGTGHEPVGV